MEVAFHKFGIVPIELYHESAVDAVYFGVLNRLEGWRGVSSDDLSTICDTTLLGSLAPLGLEQTGEWRLAWHEPAGSEGELGLYLLCGRTGITLLHHDEELVQLRQRDDAFKLADRLTLWLERDRAELAAKLCFPYWLGPLKALTEVPEGWEQTKRLIETHDEYAFVFAAVDLGPPGPDVQARVDLFRTVLNGMEFLEELSETDVYSEGSKEEFSNFLGPGQGDLLSELVKAQTSRYQRLGGGNEIDEDAVANKVTTLLQHVDRGWRRGGSGLLRFGRDLAEADLPHRRYQQKREVSWSDEHHAPGDRLPYGETRWLRARWDTALLATTNKDSIRELVAMEVALQSVWSKFASATQAVLKVHEERRVDDLKESLSVAAFEDRLLDKLSDQLLRVANWQIQLSEWQRAMFARLRQTSRLDQNIDDFYGASAESVRRSEVVRDKERAEREKRFQGAATIAGLALAAIVFGEITISIAAGGGAVGEVDGAAGEVERTVAVLGFAGTLGLAFLFVLHTFEYWSQEYRWVVGTAGLLLLVAMAASGLPLLFSKIGIDIPTPPEDTAQWLFTRAWWPWPGLPLLGLTGGSFAGVLLAWVRARVRAAEQSLSSLS